MSAASAILRSSSMELLTSPTATSANNGKEFPSPVTRNGSKHGHVGADGLPTAAVRRVAFVGTFPPRVCGIALYQHALKEAFCETFEDVRVFVCAVQDANLTEGAAGGEAQSSLEGSQSAELADGVTRDFEWDAQQASGYHRLAAYLERHRIDVVCLQHEFGIYGGSCGELILLFLRECRCPVVTTLHTVLERPSPVQRRILGSVVMLSSVVVVPSARAKRTLTSVYHADQQRVVVIPHGVSPALAHGSHVTTVEEEAARKCDAIARLRPQLQGVVKDSKLFTDTSRRFLLVFGILSPNKGIEYAIDAMPDILKQVPEAHLLIVGSTHPNLRAKHGESYRNALKVRAQEKNIGSSVTFVDAFLGPSALRDVFAATEVVIVSSVSVDQVMSGTLTTALGASTAVVSTAFRYAKSLQREAAASSEGKEEGSPLMHLVPFRDSVAIATAVVRLLRNPSERRAMQRTAYTFTREFTWPSVAGMYFRTFQKALESLPRLSKRDALNTLVTFKWGIVPNLTAYLNTRSAVSSYDRFVGDISHVDENSCDDVFRGLPDINLDYLRRMTDATGLIQFGHRVVPDFESGYCTDDNSRALTVYLKVRAVLLQLSDPAAHNYAVSPEGRTSLQTFRRLTGTTDWPLLNGENGVSKDGSNSLARLLQNSANTTGLQDRDLGETYMAFLTCAFDRRLPPPDFKGPNKFYRRFRNFMAFHYAWADPDDLASEESHGRGMQSVGHACGYDFHREASKIMFLQGIPELYNCTSPRALAHAMDGAVHFLRAFPEERDVILFLQYGGEWLLRRFDEVAAIEARQGREASNRGSADLPAESQDDEDDEGHRGAQQGGGDATEESNEHEGPNRWLWFEEYLTYSNASLPMALIEAGAVLQRPDMLQRGLQTLRWLFEVQLFHMSDDHVVFSPIGCFAAQLRGAAMEHPQHDQQPIEASTFVLAALAAHRVTGDAFWLRAARVALEWFLGENCVGVSLYDWETGGCRDGLHASGANENEGAESMLAFLLALADMKERELELKTAAPVTGSGTQQGAPALTMTRYDSVASISSSADAPMSALGCSPAQGTLCSVPEMSSVFPLCASKMELEPEMSQSPSSSVAAFGVSPQQSLLMGMLSPALPAGAMNFGGTGSFLATLRVRPS